MYKKTVRRRRAVLAALVALSLILLTAYFGESPSGSLHTIQRGFLTIISPIEDGANTVLSPVRSAFASIGHAFSTGSKSARLEKELARERSRLIAYEGEAHAYREMVALDRVDAKLSIANYKPVNATVLGQSPTIWDEMIYIDQGTSAGVQDNDPVIDSEGLVGKVELAASDGAAVMLITNHESAVSARLDGLGVHGILKPKVGDPSDLLLEYLPPETNVNPGEYVVTSGSVASPGESLYPPGIPIGVVTGSGGAYQAVDVRPLVNLHDLNSVQVLTAVNGSAPARLTRLVSTISFGGSAESSLSSSSAAQGASTEGEG